MKEVIAQEVEDVLEERVMSLQIAILWLLCKYQHKTALPKKSQPYPLYF
jgi:hypothetical protein